MQVNWRKNDKHALVYIQFEYTSQFKTTKHVTGMTASDWSQVQNIVEHDRSFI